MWGVPVLLQRPLSYCYYYQSCYFRFLTFIIAITSGCYGYALHVSGTGLTPRDFLLEHNPGPYTCIRCSRGGLLPTRAVLDFHLERLKSSCSAVDECQYGWTQPLMSDVLRKTDAILNQEFIDDLKIHEYPEFRMDYDSRDFMLTILWEPLPPDNQQLAADTPDAKHISLNKTIKQMSAAVRIHLWMLPPLSSSPPPLLVKSVPSGGRSFPTLKHSAWIRQRQGLEEHKKGNIKEVIMTMPENGFILEGLVSNVMVVAKNGFIYTAGTDLVLRGYMRTLCIAACKELGIEVKEECPRVEDLLNREYDEAFLLSAGVGLSPITEWMVDGEIPVISTGDGYSSPIVIPLPRSNIAESTSMKLRTLLIDRHFDMGGFKF